MGNLFQTILFLIQEYNEMKNVIFNLYDNYLNSEIFSFEND